jgi:hypothetical protein
MGRWTQYDEASPAPCLPARSDANQPMAGAQDAYRLPAGFTRAGYDADTGVHYFRDGAGAVWGSLASYGAMRPRTRRSSHTRPGA